MSFQKMVTICVVGAATGILGCHRDGWDPPLDPLVDAGRDVHGDAHRDDAGGAHRDDAGDDELIGGTLDNYPACGTTASIDQEYVGLPAERLLGVYCVDTTDCPNGSRCNTALTPPQCQALYAGAPGTPCSEDALCADDAYCSNELCNPCRLCGFWCRVDFSNHPEHCGCCNNPAPEGGLCSNGVPSCPSGRIECDGVCVDPMSDPAHCGGCDQPVPAGGRCSSGAPTCMDPRSTICGDACVDLEYSDTFCGACGQLCPDGYCSDGSCILHDNRELSCAAECEAAGMECREAPGWGWAQYACGVGQSNRDTPCDVTPETLSGCTLTNHACACVPVRPAA